MNTALLGLTSQIVAAYVSRNAVQVSDLPNLINNVHQSLVTLGQPPAPAEAQAELKPAVPVKKSVTPDYIVCFKGSGFPKPLNGSRFASLMRSLTFRKTSLSAFCQ